MCWIVCISLASVLSLLNYTYVHSHRVVILLESSEMVSPSPSDSGAIASRRTLTSSGSSSASSGNEKIQNETTALFKELVKCTKIDCLIIPPVYQIRPVSKLPVFLDYSVSGFLGYLLPCVRMCSRGYYVIGSICLSKAMVQVGCMATSACMSITFSWIDLSLLLHILQLSEHFKMAQITKAVVNFTPYSNEPRLALPTD